MRSLWGLLLATLVGASPGAFAKGVAVNPAGSAGALGLGLGLGTPTSLTAKYFLNGNLAIDGGLVLYRYRGGTGLQADALFHHTLTKASAASVPVYVGLGLEIGIWNEDDWWWDKGWRSRRRAGVDLALRIPFGIALWLIRAPVELYLELGPELWLLDRIGLLYGVVGGRYYF